MICEQCNASLIVCYVSIAFVEGVSVFGLVIVEKFSVVIVVSGVKKC